VHLRINFILLSTESDLLKIVTQLKIATQ